ncbi:hypothetical protein J5N97_010726 [Dioscorea zingiberensis]|uniref:Uncharacterized protein n=1 Tax=Dioscorea zingiberensis TaxID=325984 RepID=A0A9D5HN22_9LILI|nr:hypothetical protein J5N97_010726 [Dioscorea zingiberensis]
MHAGQGVRVVTLEISSLYFTTCQSTKGVKVFDKREAKTTGPSGSTVTCSLNEANVDPPDDCPDVPGDLPKAEPYDCGSPNHNITPFYVTKFDLKLDMGHTPAELVHYVQDGLDKRKGLFLTQLELEDRHQFKPNEEELAECAWENLMCDDGNDLMIFDPPTESDVFNCPNENSQDNDVKLFSSFPSSLQNDVVDDVKELQPNVSFLPYPEEVNSIHHVEHIKEQLEMDQTPQILLENCQNQAVTSDTNYKRSCDMAVPLMVGNLSPCMLPGIGLHLNTLATTSKDKLLAQGTIVSGRSLISMPSSTGPVSSSNGQEHQNKSLSIQKDPELGGNEIQDLKIMQNDVSEAPEFNNGEDLCPNSPRKKRSALYTDRPSVNIPIFSTGKPPRTLGRQIGDSSQLNSFTTFRKCDIPPSQCGKFDKLSNSVFKDDTPTILRGNSSLISGVKAVSPNRKGVWPPHFGTRLTPNT